MRTFALLSFVVFNLGVVGAYTFVAIRIMPNAAARLWRTKVGGVAFFASCALTHLELAVHAFTVGAITLNDLTSWHMFLIHLVQLVSVWAFVTGLYIENERWGPWRAAFRDRADASEPG